MGQDAPSHLVEAKEENGYELSAAFRPITEVGKLSITAGERAYLKFLK